MSDESDIDWFNKHCAKNDARRAARLTEAKREALARGKEPFDLDRLDTFYSRHSSYLSTPTREERVSELEERYYVNFSEVMTLKEFAKQLEIQDMYE